MIKASHTPYGYRELLAYKKAERLQLDCATLTHVFPRTKTLIALADQMDRSARSVKQNIVEGWKRNTSQEYYEFLGFSMGANTELEEDCTDIWKGMYPELLKERGIMGERGGKGNQGEGERGGRGEKGAEREGERADGIGDIEKLKFYPIDPSLPPVVRLKLQSKELNYLLDRLQKSLLVKMESEHTLPRRDIFRRQTEAQQNEDRAAEELMKRYSLKRLPNGQFVKEE